MGLIVLMGRAGTGKAIITKALDNRGVRKIITYTTRPLRQGEVNGVDYNFISPAKFSELKDHGFFADVHEYFSEFGRYDYGTSIEALNIKDDACISLTPSGYFSLQKLCVKDLFPVHCVLREDLVRARLFNRANKEKDLRVKFMLMNEIDKRLKLDELEFDILDELNIPEIDTSYSVESVAEYVYKLYYKHFSIAG